MKTSIIEIDSKITVYILNNYKCFAKISMDYGAYIPTEITHVQGLIEDKLGVKILMVRFDTILNVVEFYILK